MFYIIGLISKNVNNRGDGNMFKNRQFFLLSLFIILFLSACSHVTNENPEDKVDDITNDNGEFCTPDGKLTFKIYNQGGFSKTTTEQIKEETLEAYDTIINSVETGYERPAIVNIYLFPGEGRPSSNTADIMLYNIHTNTYELVHELTHVLLGYGGKTTAENGRLTQEGIAVYLQNKIGNISAPNFGIPIHEVMKYIIDTNNNLPMYKLVKPDIAHSIFIPATNNPEDRSLYWIAYTQSSSFITYIFEKYGADKFGNIYNHPNLNSQIQKVYGKSLEELEADWLKYIDSNYESVSDKKLNSYFHYFLEGINNIDKEFFERG